MLESEKKTLFVAVVVGKETNEYELNSNSTDGDWASFLGATEQEAVAKAAVCVAKWNAETHYNQKASEALGSPVLSHHRGSPYRIFVAATTGEAKVDVPYTVARSAVEVFG